MKMSRKINTSLSLDSSSGSRRVCHVSNRFFGSDEHMPKKLWVLREKGGYGKMRRERKLLSSKEVLEEVTVACDFRGRFVRIS